METWLTISSIPKHADRQLSAQAFFGKLSLSLVAVLSLSFKAEWLSTRSTSSFPLHWLSWNVQILKDANWLATSHLQNSSCSRAIFSPPTLAVSYLISFCTELWSPCRGFITSWSLHQMVNWYSVRLSKRIRRDLFFFFFSFFNDKLHCQPVH